MNKNKRNFWLDLTLLVLLILTTVTGLFVHGGGGRHVSPPADHPGTVVNTLHIVFGIIMIIVTIPHLGFHEDWLKAVIFKPTKPKSGRARANAVIDSILFILLVAIVVTGIIGKGHFHMTLGILFVLTIGIHQLLHVKWIVRNTQRYLLGIEPEKQKPAKSSTYSPTP